MISITGVTIKSNILEKFNKQVLAIKGRTKAGMWKAGLIIKAASIKYTPWKTGNLAGSAYVQIIDTPHGPGVEIGYTASYAPYVHEMPDFFNFTKPGTGPKFLQRAIYENRERVLRTIEQEARIR